MLPEGPRARPIMVCANPQRARTNKTRSTVSMVRTRSTTAKSVKLVLVAKNGKIGGPGMHREPGSSAQILDPGGRQGSGQEFSESAGGQRGNNETDSATKRTSTPIHHKTKGCAATCVRHTAEGDEGGVRGRNECATNLDDGVRVGIELSRGGIEVADAPPNTVLRLQHMHCEVARLTYPMSGREACEREDYACEHRVRRRDEADAADAVANEGSRRGLPIPGIEDSCRVASHGQNPAIPAPPGDDKKPDWAVASP